MPRPCSCGRCLRLIGSRNAHKASSNNTRRKMFSLKDDVVTDYIGRVFALMVSFDILTPHPSIARNATENMFLKSQQSCKLPRREI